MGLEYWIGAIGGLFIFMGILLAILRAERRYWMRRAMKATQSETLRVVHRGPEAQDAVQYVSGTPSVSITSLEACPLCDKPIGVGAISTMLPSGRRVHPGCFNALVAKGDPDGIPGVHDV